MYEKFFLLFYILSINIQFSKQGECSHDDYNISASQSPGEMCKAFSYRFNNSICYYNEQNGTCLNISEGSELIKNNSNYSLAVISNNCGISGFFEPLVEGDCKEIPLVDGQCCFVEYQSNGTKHKACLRTNEYQKKDELPTEIKNLFQNKYSKFELMSAVCKGKYIKNYFNFILIFLIFLIWNIIFYKIYEYNF